ncbi:MAG TPA: diguanylate cyclase [Burkholderiales bacterium]|nr:diguanylate cyclase [Burkholderiales bacterium]
MPALSLRTRFVLGLGAVLLPFLLAGAVGLFYLLPRLIDPLEDVVREVTEEIHPATRLQVKLLVAETPVSDYLIYGDHDERQRFAQLRREVDEAFAAIAQEPFTLKEQESLIASAGKQWQQSLPFAEAILRQRHPVGNPSAVRMMETFDAHIDRAVALLDQVQAVADREIGRARAVAQAARTRSEWITFGAFAAALAISLLASAVLARSLLSGVDVLRAGAARLADGELSHRVRLAREDELGELAAVFDAMAERLEKSRAALTELATRDSLTGLLNRREFMVRLSEELERSRRYRHSCALLLLDLDHFKAVNDSHGHVSGDEVLRIFADRVRQTLRPADQPARYGGEEFAVILPETGSESALAVAERIRGAIAARAFALAAGRAIELTVSVGVAAFPDDAQTVHSLIAAADRALYAAKQAGRNRVCRTGTAAPGEPQPGGRA